MLFGNETGFHAMFEYNKIALSPLTSEPKPNRVKQLFKYLNIFLNIPQK